MKELAPRRVFLVVPWYGPDTAGGAELLARRLAENLHREGVAIQVLTTTGKDFFSPQAQDHYPAGPQEVNGVPVIRFPTRQDDGASWRQAHAGLLTGVSFPTKERHMVDQLVAEDALYSYIQDHRQEGLFLLVPYVWGTTFWGGLLAGDHAVVIPCLHDEAYARYRPYHYLFQQVRGGLFISHPERKLARRLYDLPAERALLVGAGVDIPATGDPDRLRRRLNLEEPLVCYVGRRDRGKRVPMLIEYFCAYKDRNPGPLKLLLAGKEPIFVPLEFADQVIDLGYISEQDKHDAYAAAKVVCQPSVVESFSLVIMEAWLQGTPVLVNAACDVTVYHCRQSNGGLYFRDFFEFEACLNELLERPRLRRRLGAQGRGYVQENYSWPAVVERVIAALGALGVQVPYRPVGASAEPAD